MWLAYQRLNRLYDCHDMPARTRLVDDWHAVAAKLGAGYRDGKGERIPQTGDVYRMPMHTLAKQVKRWTKELGSARARRWARAKITTHFRPVARDAGEARAGSTGPGGEAGTKRPRESGVGSAVARWPGF